MQSLMSAGFEPQGPLDMADILLDQELGLVMFLLDPVGPTITNIIIQQILYAFPKMNI